MKHFKLLAVFLVAMMLFAFTSCSKKTDTNPPTSNNNNGSTVAPDNNANNGQSGGGYSKITAEEAKSRIESGDNIVILDVRTAEEYAEKHIEGAVLLPVTEITESSVMSVLPDKNAEILVYCRSGNRSKQAADLLISMGYTNVKDFGGINDWTYATVSGEYTNGVADGSGTNANNGSATNGQGATDNGSGTGSTTDKQTSSGM